VSTTDLVLKRAQKGDKSAIDALLRQHYDSIRAVCHRIVLNSADADDATQMALIAIVRGLPRFDRRSSFQTWIYRIATNAALDEVRRIQRRPIPVEEKILEQSSPGTHDAVDTQMVMKAALQEIPEDYRVVLVLRHIADLDYEDIAAIANIPVGTVRSRLARGRAQLSEIVGNQLGYTTRQTSADQNDASTEGRP
jgi:RNA polymerase sigma-70 factor, ECF subfamily